MTCEYAAGTDLGARDKNEDSFICDPEHGLWCVADGIGGLAFGEIASAIATFTLGTMIRSGHGVNQTIEATHEHIRDYAQELANGANMGTSLVLLLTDGSLYNVFWAGDSRAYRYDGSLTTITRDHTHLQSLIDSGELTTEEAAEDPRKNGLTKALGIHQLQSVRADSVNNRWLPGEKILLCSDGLSGYLEDDEIEAILSTEGTDEDRVQKLISASLAAGSLDNITVILVNAPAFITPPVDDDTEVPEELDLNEFNRPKD